jgi:DNA-binding MarR family transcriptional regulator
MSPPPAPETTSQTGGKAAQTVAADAATATAATVSAPVPAPAAAAKDEAWNAELLELGKAFRRVFRGLIRMRGRDTHLAEGELSHAQFELLIELDERGALPAGELAAAAKLAPATVTQMLDHLADSGQVERVRSETDRRVVVSQLTDQGREKIEAKRAAWQARWEQALDGVSARELRSAKKVLERLNAVFADASDCDQRER